MSFNPEKMANIILNECESIEEKCEGYKEKLVRVIVEIISTEKEHSVRGIRIQKEINKICDNAGDFLMKKRDMDETGTEGTQ